MDSNFSGNLRTGRIGVNSSGNLRTGKIEFIRRPVFPAIKVGPEFLN